MRGIGAFFDGGTDLQETEREQLYPSIPNGLQSRKSASREPNYDSRTAGQVCMVNNITAVVFPGCVWSRACV